MHENYLPADSWNAHYLSLHSVNFTHKQSETFIKKEGKLSLTWYSGQGPTSLLSWKFCTVTEMWQVFQAPACWNGILHYFAKYGLAAFVNSGSKINA